jgi:hypothetical protein
MKNISDTDLKVWGLDSLPIALHSKNYGWDNIVKPDKKFMLSNPHDYKGRINLSSLVSCWRETGHSEWEYLLSAWLIYSVIDALEKGNEHADISILFSRDLIANPNRRFTKEQVYKHIMPSFDKVGEDEKHIYLQLRLK